MSELSVFQPPFRKVLEGTASRQQMYSLFNRHRQAPFDEKRMTGSQYAGEWFEVTERDHDRMSEILPPLFYSGDMFAMREFIGASITSVFFTLSVGGRQRWFHGYCDLAEHHSCGEQSVGLPCPDGMRNTILERESRADRTMNASRLSADVGEGLLPVGVNRPSNDGSSSSRSDTMSGSSVS